MTTKVGEHITLDIIGAKKEYDPVFFEKLVYKIAKIAKVTVLEISKYNFAFINFHRTGNICHSDSFLYEKQIALIIFIPGVAKL